MLACLAAPALCLGFAAWPQEPHRPGGPLRGVMPKAIADTLEVAADQTRVVLKLQENRPDLALPGHILDAGVLAVLADRRTRPFFAGREQELAAIRARQIELAGGERPAVDLGLYFEVQARDAADARSLVRALNELAAVELAYPRERPAPPPGDILPATPDYTDQQGYREAAPLGIDATFGGTITGASGRGVRLVEIEWGWHFDHEDVSQLRPGALIGPPVANPSYNDHGVAVAGELAADADAHGVTGLVPDIDLRVATNYPASGYSVANAIAVAVPALSAGDVIVLEAQTSTPLGLGPTEWIQADFDAIFVATTLGIVTVEAAGNGGVDLDAPVLGGLFDRSVRDSGAIVVGATHGSQLGRAPFSCYGSRVDANGWGYQVVTTGYGNLAQIGGDSRQRYTNTFSGTSSATPMVTAAVCALRGAAQAQWDAGQVAALTPIAVRNLVAANGTPTNPGQDIGVRADIRAVLAAAGLLRGLAVVGEPRLGSTCGLEVGPAAPAGIGDAYAVLASFTAVNQALTAAISGSGRVLVDPAAAVTMTVGVHGTAAGLVPFTVPNDLALRGTRIYAQSFSFVVPTAWLAAGNSCELFVRR